MKYEIENGIKGGFHFTSLSKYYPTRFQVEKEYQDVRGFIYSFKDGINSTQFGGTLANMITQTAFLPRNEWWICIIPASTQSKTRTRFFNFCNALARGTAMNNGYDLIYDTIDRDAIHAQADRNTINILDSLGFQDVTGKKILLFDDVYTTGKSFFKVATKLTELGASEVYGMFLGKTTWLEE
jgi:predicted amidophosphoribosyltransferase